MRLPCITFFFPFYTRISLSLHAITFRRKQGTGRNYLEEKGEGGTRTERASSPFGYRLDSKVAWSDSDCKGAAVRYDRTIQG